MDCFVPLLLDTDDSGSDLPASVFTFGGRTAPPEDGVYFINALLITSGGGDNTTIKLYCVDVCFLSFFLAYMCTDFSFLAKGHATNRWRSCPTFCRCCWTCVPFYRPAHNRRALFETFHEAASDFGLFDNHNEGFLTLQEAVDSHRTPSQLRFLFAQVLSSKTALGHLSECCLARLYPSRG